MGASSVHNHGSNACERLQMHRSKACILTQVAAEGVEVLGVVQLHDGCCCVLKELHTRTHVASTLTRRSAQHVKGPCLSLQARCIQCHAVDDQRWAPPTKVQPMVDETLMQPCDHCFGIHIGARAAGNRLSSPSVPNRVQEGHLVNAQHAMRHRMHRRARRLHVAARTMHA
jgi:hypothetical protein